MNSEEYDGLSEEGIMSETAQFRVDGNEYLAPATDADLRMCTQSNACRLRKTRTCVLWDHGQDHERCLYTDRNKEAFETIQRKMNHEKNRSRD